MTVLKPSFLALALALGLAVPTVAAAADDDCKKTSAALEIDGATGLVYEVDDASGRRILLRGGVVELSFAHTDREPVSVVVDLIPPSDPAETPVVPDIIIRTEKNCPPPT